MSKIIVVDNYQKDRKSGFIFPNNFIFLGLDQERRYLMAIRSILFKDMNIQEVEA